MRKFRSFPTARTREEAQAMADTWVALLTADGRVARATVGDLLEDYIAMRERRGLAAQTARSWRSLARNYVCPRIGGRLARDVDVVDVNRLYSDLLAEGGEGGAPLSRGTVRLVHTMLLCLWGHLVASGVCESNPVSMALAPSLEHAEATDLCESDMREVDRELEGATKWEGGARRACMAMAAWLALHAGLRVGEACGLRLRDVVASGPWLHVGGQVDETLRPPARKPVTKGKRSRNVTLTRAEMAVVERFAAAQRAALGRRGGDAPLVSWDGRWARPTCVSNAFSGLARELGLPRGVSFHSLRHTHATQCIAAGVDVKTLSERLGHADVATTLRYYAHAIPGRDAAAAEAFERRAAGGHG